LSAESIQLLKEGLDFVAGACDRLQVDARVTWGQFAGFLQGEEELLVADALAFRFRRPNTGSGRTLW